MSDSVRPHRRQPTRLPRSWGSPGKNAGVCCHFLLQYMKVKSESEVTQLCPTLSDPMDCSPPGSSIHGSFQARALEWVPCINTLHAVLNCFSHVQLCDPMDCSPLGSSAHGILQTRILEGVARPSCRESSRPRDGTCISYVSCFGSWVLYQ